MSDSDKEKEDKPGEKDAKSEDKETDIDEDKPEMKKTKEWWPIMDAVEPKKELPQWQLDDLSITVWEAIRKTLLEFGSNYNQCDVSTLKRVKEMLETLNSTPNYSDFFHTKTIDKWFNTKFFGSCMRSLLSETNCSTPECELLIS